MIPLWARSIPIWVYAAILVLGVIGWQRIEVSRYRAQAITFKSAQETNLATIATLQRTNTDWASKCKANQPEARQQAQESAQIDAKRQASAAKSIKSLQATYEHEPTAKAWADTRVPTAVVRMLASAGQD